MSVRVTLELHVKPEAAEQMKGGFKELLPDTRAFDGCEEISVLQNQEDPTMFLVVEQWETRESYEAYLKWRTDRGDMDNIAAVSTEPYKVSYFDYVRA
jgi:quinol monooxygenase YgiN